jgi:hypothetical protein
MTSYILAALAAVLFGVFFFKRTQAKQAVAIQRRADMRGVIASVLDNVADEPQVTIGVDSWRGEKDGTRVQVRTIVDTLATRKLPALWLSVTVNEPININATIDLMARPNSVTTFSNFDLLPHSIPTPSSFPEFVGIRSNDPQADFPLTIIAPHLGIFESTRMKELLIAPNGVRLVVLAAEADRARYGVFRQADFSEFNLDAALVERLIETAAQLRDDINNTKKTGS